jgi:hypothetical protein
MARSSWPTPGDLDAVARRLEIAELTAPPGTLSTSKLLHDRGLSCIPSSVCRPCYRAVEAPRQYIKIFMLVD